MTHKGHAASITIGGINLGPANFEITTPDIRLLDEFRMAVAVQCKTHETFWKEMADEWVMDWRRRHILKALVANHGP